MTLIGSHRKNGNTAQIVGLIEEQLRVAAAKTGESLEIESAYLGERKIGMCRGCRICFDQGEEECPLQDDLLAIRASMQAADGLIVATPVYVDDVSGTVKNWIDRLAFVCHRPEFAGKSAFLVATVGIGPTSHTLRTLRMALMSWGYHIVGQAGFKMGALMPREQTVARYGQRAERIAREFSGAIRKRTYATPSFLSLMTFKIQQRSWHLADRDSVDYAYWHGQGWTEPEREYYIEHEASRAKVASARLAGALLARFVT
jgi:multimeric flavodoxin WrbA